MNRFFNNVLTSVTVFMLTFSWLNYCTKSKTISALLALNVAVSVCVLLYIVGKNKWEKQKISKAKKQELYNFENFLTWNDTNTEMFADLLEFCNYKTSQMPNGFLLLEKDGKKTLGVVSFVATEKLSAGEIQNAVVTAKRLGVSKIMLFTNKELPLNVPFEVETNNVETTYELFCRCGKLPPLGSKKQPKKPFFSANAFTKKRFGKYALGSLFLAVFSLFSFFPVYTLVWSSVMLALAFCCLLNKQQKNDEL